MVTLNKDDELIYELIFSDNTNFVIDLSDYVEDVYNYSDFVSRIKKILKKSKVEVLRSTIKQNTGKVHWELKVKK